MCRRSGTGRPDLPGLRRRPRRLDGVAKRAFGGHDFLLMSCRFEGREPTSQTLLKGAATDAAGFKPAIACAPILRMRKRSYLELVADREDDRDVVTLGCSGRRLGLVRVEQLDLHLALRGQVGR